MRSRRNYMSAIKITRDQNTLTMETRSTALKRNNSVIQGLLVDEVTDTPTKSPIFMETRSAALKRKNSVQPWPQGKIQVFEAISMWDLSNELKQQILDDATALDDALEQAYRLVA